jgi:hypothetical protein
MNQLGYKVAIDCRGYRFEGAKKFMKGELSNCLCLNSG